jgi:DNA-binding NarL/FixJ family response regulator
MRSKIMAEKKVQSKTDINKSKILIVDDHPIVRRGLTDLINHEEDLVVSGQAEDAHQAMEAIRAQKPDMAIVDISLKGTSGLELIKDIKTRYPGLLVLTLSMHDESLYAERALRAGAKGYIMKQQATEDLIMAIRKVLAGHMYVSDMVTTRMVGKVVGGGPDVGASAIDRLSDRELEVFGLIGLGHGTRQIAERLHLSVKTVETYRAHIKRKLNLANAAELLRYAIQWANSQRAG